MRRSAPFLEVEAETYHYIAAQCVGFGIGETDYSVQSTTFLRMSAVTLSYNFNSEFIKKAKMSNLRIYVTGSNLLTFTKYKGYDPEGGNGYPTSKMFVAGVNVGF